MVGCCHVTTIKLTFVTCLVQLHLLGKLQVCFSKLATEALLLCDICEKEWHMECLHPALLEVHLAPLSCVCQAVMYFITMCVDVP
jgi:hypothetical protein